MDNNWAAENLSLIRTLMERSALYRRALTPIMFFLGFLGIASALVGAGLKLSTSAFALYWSAAALAGLAGAFLLARRQAIKDVEPFWSAPTRHVAHALLPSFVVGAILAGLAIAAPPARSEQFVPVLPAIWMALYGCGLVSAGFFMRRGIRVLGWVFIAAGGVLLSGSMLVTGFWDWERQFGHALMGCAFGVLHLLCGLYLQISKEAPSAS